MFKIVNGNLEENIKKEKEKQTKKTELYKDLYNDYKYGIEHEYDLKKSIYYGMKYISRLKLSPEMTYRDYALIFITMQDLNSSIMELTIRDLINMFPILKEYDGKKYECKDYFSTKEYLLTKNIDKELETEDEVQDFFSNYYNNDIICYAVKQYLIVDKLRKFENKPSLMESFIDMVDTEHKIDTYTYHEKEGYLYNKNTGKTIKVTKAKKRKPKYLNTKKG